MYLMRAHVGPCNKLTDFCKPLGMALWSENCSDIKMRNLQQGMALCGVVDTRLLGAPIPPFLLESIIPRLQDEV